MSSVQKFLSPVLIAVCLFSTAGSFALDKKVEWDSNIDSTVKKIEDCIKTPMAPGCQIVLSIIGASFFSVRAASMFINASNKEYERDVRNGHRAVYHRSAHVLQMRLEREHSSYAGRLKAADDKMRRLEIEFEVISNSPNRDFDAIRAKEIELQTAGIKLYVLKETLSDHSNLIKAIPAFPHAMADNVVGALQMRKQLDYLVEDLHKQMTREMYEAGFEQHLNLLHGANQGIFAWRFSGSLTPLAKWLESADGQAYLRTKAGQNWQDHVKDTMSQGKDFADRLVELDQAMAQRENPSRAAHSEPAYGTLRRSLPDSFAGNSLFDPARFFRVSADRKTVSPVKDISVLSADMQTRCDWSAEKLGEGMHNLKRAIKTPDWAFNPRKLVLIASPFAAYAGALYYFNKDQRAATITAQKVADATEEGLLGQFKKEHSDPKKDKLTPFLDSSYTYMTQPQRGADDKLRPSLNEQLNTFIGKQIDVAAETEKQEILEANLSAKQTNTELADIEDRRKTKHAELANQSKAWSDKDTIKATLENSLREQAEARGWPAIKTVKDYLYYTQTKKLDSTEVKEFMMSVYRRSLKKIYAGVIDDKMLDKIETKHFTSLVLAVREFLKEHEETHTEAKAPGAEASPAPAPAGFNKTSFLDDLDKPSSTGKQSLNPVQKDLPLIIPIPASRAHNPVKFPSNGEYGDAAFRALIASKVVLSTGLTEAQTPLRPGR